MTRRDELTNEMMRALRTWLKPYEKWADTSLNEDAAAVRKAFRALYALPAEAEAEGVEVRQDVWWHPEWREWRTEKMNPTAARQAGWQHIATLRARVPLPRIPEVAADVEGV